MKAMSFFILLGFLTFQTAVAHHFIPEIPHQTDPPYSFVNGQRVVPVVDIPKYNKYHTSAEAEERCGRGRVRERHGRCGSSRHYYKRRYSGPRCSDRGRRHHAARFIRWQWANRLNGRWEADHGWNRHYEIIVVHNAVKIRKRNGFIWHTLYPVMLRDKYGIFEDHHGHYLEWDHGDLLWHYSGDNRVKYLSRTDRRDCFR